MSTGAPARLDEAPAVEAALMSSAAAELARLGGEAHAQAHQITDAVTGHPEVTRRLQELFRGLGDVFIAGSTYLGEVARDDDR